MTDISVRDEDRRKRDDDRLTQVQEQLAELRWLLQESQQRQAQTEEAYQTLEATVHGYAEQIEAARGEARAFNGEQRAELGQLRAQIEDLESRVAGALAPLPSLQEQFAELSGQARLKFQQIDEDRPLLGELQTRIDHLPPLVDRSVELTRGIGDQLAGLRDDLESMRQDWRKANDATGLVEQDMRRRTGDLATLISRANERIDALKEELPPLDLQIDRVRQELHQSLPKFGVVESANTDLREEIDRVAALAFDRHLQAMAKADELRSALEERIRQIERLNDTRFSSTMARFTDLENGDRGVSHRITMLAMRLDELRAEDAAIRKELIQMEELRLKVRIEQAQQEALTFSQRLANLDHDTDEEE